jgi:hypothetical protein
MAVNLKADNRAITRDSKYSYLIDNYSSGSSAITITNAEGFFSNSYVVIGDVGSENTEILQIKKVNPTTKELTFANFSATAIGNGLYTVTVNNPGTGYQVGETLTVVQAGGVGGTIRVWGVDGAGAITDITDPVSGAIIDQAGYGYTVANGLVTSGGGNNDATINITALTTTSTPTTILFANSQSFIAGQPVEVFSGTTGVSRGTGTVAANSDPTSSTMTLSGSGVIGTIAGDLIVVGDVTRFAHSESTKVAVVQYNQIRFFITNTPTVPNIVPVVSTTTNQNKSTTETTISTISTPHTTRYTQPDDPSSVTTLDFTPPITFSGATALTIPLSIQVNDFYTTFIDTINSTGYGWFCFYNSTTATYSPVSNAIPYSGFAENTVKKAFEAFDSSLNTKELKLITQSDRFNWINEAIAYTINELNLGNWEFSGSEELQLDIYAGVSKYLLPQDFSNLLFINDSKNIKVEAYSATFERANVSSVMTYAIRGKFLTFYPAPEEDTYVTVAYLKLAPVMKTLDDIIDLPDNAYYALKDFMRFRAYQKLQNSTESGSSFTFFNKQIENMKIRSFKRDEGLDSWGIADTANT